jgi:hypothetical protein
MSTPKGNEWRKRFKEGRKDVHDNIGTERPGTSTSDENVSKIKGIVLTNCRIAVRQGAEEVDISYSL